MNSIARTLRDSVTDYCANIGADSMLVQGAGGNASWKDDETLWVKASGTWLAEAAQKQIFVPVDLTHLQSAISLGDFQVNPNILGESSLRPSIETLLHALMPHRVVVHLHAIEILACLVRSNCDAQIRALVGTSLRWLNIGYFSPGADLAKAVSRSMKEISEAEVVFLKNHGVVIGGESVEKVDEILKRLVTVFYTPPRISRKVVEKVIAISKLEQIEKLGYRMSSNRETNLLAQDGSLFERLAVDWALYPDHVVFLGPKALRFDCIDDFISSCSSVELLPELVFVRDIGTFEGEKFSPAQKVQLKCYSDVMMRQADDVQLSSLTDEHIAGLLNWDAEKYRKNLSL